MVDVSPTGASDHRAARYSCGSRIFLGSVPVEENRVTTARIRTCPGYQVSVGIQLRVVIRFQLVAATKLVETCVGNLNIACVHEHHVAATIYLLICRFDDHIARRVGNVNF